MDAKEIIENISDLYARFKIPGHLEWHMRLVAGVTAWLCDHVQESVDRDLLVAAALIHDMGNIVKFDFSHQVDRGESFNCDVEELKKIQLEMEEKYGTNDHVATMNMLTEVGVNQEILTLLDEADWRVIAKATNNHAVAAMILSYADYRVAPGGVVSVDERIADIHTRYKKKHNIKFNEDKFQRTAQAYRDLEKELFKLIKEEPKDISSETISAYK